MGYPWTTGSGTMRKEAGQTHKSLISSWILSWEVWGHFRGLSQARTLKVHNPALPPSFGVLTRRQLFHGSWTSNIIRNRWWMKWKKKNSSLTHVGARNATCFEMAIRSRILAWKPHGWRSLVGYSPKSCKESDTTGQLSTCALLSRHNATCRDPRHLRVSLPEGTACTWRHNTSGGMVPGSSMVTSGQQARENPTIHIVWVPGCKPGTVWMLRQRGEL